MRTQRICANSATPAEFQLWLIALPVGTRAACGWFSPDGDLLEATHTPSVWHQA